MDISGFSSFKLCLCLPKGMDSVTFFFLTLAFIALAGLGFQFFMFLKYVQ